MESRNKFFSGGAWCSDSIVERHEHIKKVLELYLQNGIDEDDLKYIIKNAFVSKIYISDEAKKNLEEYSKQAGENWKLKKLYEKICKDGFLQLPGETDCLSHFDFCEVIKSQVNSNGKEKIKLFRIEHVVPGKVYIEDVLKKVDKNLENFSQAVFNGVFYKVYICIVTKDEANALDKGLRYTMPKGKDFKEEPFARYEEKGITIHGLGNNYPKYKCDKV